MFFESLLSVFNFGKFKGCELGEVLMCSPEYVEWVIENVNGSICAFSDNTIKEINLIFPNFVFSDDMMNRIKEQQQEYYENESDGIENIIYEVEDWQNDNEDTFERYNGSFVQDEMDYSDDDIDTIFDGDPSAYWNID